ncbi:unnamed protein product [Ilex paraguariensis]|uniref:Uncharacterized protein n=1 Tax=Ilex paraguariensis TaxID=185542 RepID=A0ABC8UBA3_9AQUA
MPADVVDLVTFTRTKVGRFVQSVNRKRHSEAVAGRGSVQTKEEKKFSFWLRPSGTIRRKVGIVVASTWKSVKEGVGSPYYICGRSAFCVLFSWARPNWSHSFSSLSSESTTSIS